MSNLLWMLAVSESRNNFINWLIIIYKSLLVTRAAHLTSDEIIIGNINKQLHKKDFSYVSKTPIVTHSALFFSQIISHIELSWTAKKTKRYLWHSSDHHTGQKNYLWHSSNWSQGAHPDGQMLALHSPVEGLVAFTVQEPRQTVKDIRMSSRNLDRSTFTQSTSLDKKVPSWRLVGWPCLSQVFTYWSKLASSGANSWKMISWFSIKDHLSEMRLSNLDEFRYNT